MKKILLAFMWLNLNLAYAGQTQLPFPGSSGGTSVTFQFDTPVGTNNSLQILHMLGDFAGSMSNTTHESWLYLSTWSYLGNTGVTNGFLGTLDGNPLVLKVANRTVGRFTTNSTPNIILGASNITVDASLTGATVGGGGGHSISAGSTDATIAGGTGNVIYSNSMFSTISGGSANKIVGSGVPWARRASFIGGGIGNVITGVTASVADTIVGGNDNQILSGTYSFIGGGTANRIVGGENAIVGGNGNVMASSVASFMGGGQGNNMNSNSDYSVVFGGSGQKMNPNGASRVIYSGILSGRDNSLLGPSTNTVMVGGYTNVAQGSSVFLGGGELNVVTGGSHAVLGGGQRNLISGNHSVIGGGTGNTNMEIRSVIGGGRNNYIQGVGFGGANTISGGQDNRILFGTIATIAGGASNDATNTQATVSGGAQNVAGGNSSVIAGGAWNRALGVFSMVAGGYTNAATGYASFTGGGQQNIASASNSAAMGAGASAVHNNSYVWSDGLTIGGSSARTNTFNIYAAGGFLINSQEVFDGFGQIQLTASSNIMAAANSAFVNIEGDTMTGTLTMPTGVVSGTFSVGTNQTVAGASIVFANNLVPALDGVQSLGDATHRMATVYVASVIDSANTLSINYSNGAPMLKINPLGVLWHAGGNATTGSVSSTTILEGTILDADISGGAAIAANKIANTALVQNTSFGGNLSGFFNNLTINANVIGTPQLQTGSVTTVQIQDNTITNNDIGANASISPGKIQGSALVQTTVFGPQVTGTFNNLTIGQNVIGSANIINASITNDDIGASAAINRSKIAGIAITAQSGWPKTRLTTFVLDQYRTNGAQRRKLTGSVILTPTAITTAQVDIMSGSSSPTQTIFTLRMSGLAGTVEIPFNADIAPNEIYCFTNKSTGAATATMNTNLYMEWNE